MQIDKVVSNAADGISGALVDFQTVIEGLKARLWGLFVSLPEIMASELVQTCTTLSTLSKAVGNTYGIG